ncbi:response regulator [Dyella telluris]|uniref:Response regulator transcription factor n=1 Tax=Dyella telluris TaxID=2763498 RepID=A0A7G8Q2K4_9GAMM|nr:response regulator transcription factor [Dyella telluris]QNK01012.1 response regulator transcription factor [Dyella telluris]
MKRATLVLAEDHAPIAEQLRELLGEVFDVLAVVAHGEALVKAVRRLQPDAVVTDISMPGMDGMQAARELLADRPGLPVVFITVHDDVTLARAALSIGKGYVLKASAGDELIDALEHVLAGDYFLSPALGRIETVVDQQATTRDSR